MSRKILVLSVLALGLIVPTSAKVYTRDEAIQIALENSPDVKAAEEELVVAKSQVEAGYGNAYPTLDFSATYARTFGLDDVHTGATPITDAFNETKKDSVKNGVPSKYDNIAASTLDGIASGMAALKGYRWGTQIGLTLTQILYAQGKVGTAIDIAKVYKHMTEVKLEETKASIKFAVDQAIDNLLVADSAVIITEENIAIIQSHLDFVTKSFESGMVSELNLIRAKLQLEQLQAALQTAKKNLVFARNAVLTIIGLPYDAEAKFEGELMNPENATPADTVLEHVKSRLRTLAMLDDAEKMADLKINIDDVGFKPNVVLGGSITYQSGNNDFFDWDRPDWDKNINKKVYLSVSMNLFNGFQTREAVVQSKSALRSAQITKENANRTIQLAIETNLNALEESEKNLELSKSSLALAKRNQELTEEAFKVGKAPQLDLLDANMSLRQAQLSHMQAVLGWNTAYKALLKATGEY